MIGRRVRRRKGHDLNRPAFDEFRQSCVEGRRQNNVTDLGVNGIAFLCFRIGLKGKVRRKPYLVWPIKFRVVGYREV